MKVRLSIATVALLICAPVLAVKLNSARSADLIVDPAVQLGNQPVNGKNSLAIVWQTRETRSAFTLRYSQSGAPKTVKPTFKSIRIEGMEPHRFYTANLTALKPGAKIAYELRQDGKLVFKSSVAAPKGEAQPYTFAVFGDCGRDTPEEAQISYQTYKTNPDFVIMTGDIVYNDGRASEYRKNFYPYYTSELASPKNGSPLLSTSLVAGTPGNHDILNRNFGEGADMLAYFYYWAQPLNGPITRVGDPSSPTLEGPADRTKAFLANAGSNYPRLANYSFDYGNAHWTMLDANPYVNWSDPVLRDWLRKDLAAAKNKAWRFVAFHQPGFHSSKKHQEQKQMRQVADLFEQGKVDVVFMGHVHNYQRSHPIQVGNKAGASKAELEQDNWPVDRSFDGLKNTKPKGVIYLVDGAGGTYLYDPEYQSQPSKWKPFTALYSSDFSFSHVSITGKTFKLKQINKSGQVVDRFTITK